MRKGADLFVQSTICLVRGTACRLGFEVGSHYVILAAERIERSGNFR